MPVEHLEPDSPAPVWIAELLVLRNPPPPADVCEAVRRALDLPPFGPCEGASGAWVATRHDGIECHVAALDEQVHVLVGVRGGHPHAADPAWSGNVLVPAVAGAVARALGRPVWHASTMLRNLTTRCWSRCFDPSGESPPPPVDWHGAAPNAPPPPAVAPPAWRPNLILTTDPDWRPGYDGPLDFCFLVHPRVPADRVRPFPATRGIPEAVHHDLWRGVQCLVISRLEVEAAGRTLRGELLSIPFTPTDMMERLPEAQEAAAEALAYAADRGTRILGLGGLLPAMTRYGERLVGRAGPVGITTGHGFTALAIADYVTRIEAARGDRRPVAVVGAAGSTGRAAVRRLLADRPDRRLILHDLPHRLGHIPVPPGSPPGRITVTADRAALRGAGIVVCVTNAPGSILRADDFGPDCVILDDAQPENVAHAGVAARPDLTVVKCLARVPGLRCPFDFGLFAPTAQRANQEVTFTCLAETVLLALAGHAGSFTVGDPRDEQMTFLRAAAARYGIGIAPFHSFPEVGPVSLTRLSPAGRVG